MCLISGTPALGTCTRGMSPKTSDFEDQHAFHPGDLKNHKEFRVCSGGLPCTLTHPRTPHIHSSLKSTHTMYEGDSFANLRASNRGLAGLSPRTEALASKILSSPSTLSARALTGTIFTLFLYRVSAGRWVQSLHPLTATPKPVGRSYLGTQLVTH